ncbi:MAG TPA: NUDIX hydrolase [Acidimicrobiales bacterium]|nr:NUDIX hydrolase [Acidimicrobiales bacterium]
MPAELVRALRSETVVRAAGGLVVRDGQEGPEVLLVHRPRYDDWSFPKGKLDPGESDEHAAIREVEEETGYRCSLEIELPSTSYFDAKGRPKLVRYWLMRVVDGDFAAYNEVDQILWLPAAAARAKLTYDHDRDLTEYLT